MSLTTAKDLRFPLNNDAVRKLTSLLGRRSAILAALAANAGLVMSSDCGNQIEQPREITDLWFMLPLALASGESGTLDVQKSTNGGGAWATVLSGTYALTASTPVKEQISLMSTLLAASKGLTTGTMLRIVVTYVAGGGPAAPPITVVAECGTTLQD